MKHKIHGDDMQLVEITLNNETVRSETGAMLYMDSKITMETKAGSVFKGLKRMITGESFFITKFSGTGTVAFAAPHPGKIIHLKLTEEFICQRNAFLCSTNDTEINIAFTKKLGAGFFGGEGFILQSLKKGEAFIHAGGTIIEKTLKSGEQLKVDTGCIVGFSSKVDYDIKFTGIKNALFSGEGLFLATLSGPGKVYLQSLPFSRLARRIAKATMKQRGEKSNSASFKIDI
jgi:uncharacterized protein (TIGR00266 family)